MNHLPMPEDWMVRKALREVEDSGMMSHAATRKIFERMGISYEGPVLAPAPLLQQACSLLERAASSLQEYCTELNGDLNDGLANEIEIFLKHNGHPQI